MAKNSIILGCNESIFTFIHAFNSYFQYKYNNLSDDPLVNPNHLNELSESQRCINAILSQLIEEIFHSYYYDIEKEYSQKETKPFFIFLLSLVNYCDTPSEIMVKWIVDHLPQAVGWVENYLSDLKTGRQLTK